MIRTSCLIRRLVIPCENICPLTVMCASYGGGGHGGGGFGNSHGEGGGWGSSRGGGGGWSSSRGGGQNLRGESHGKRRFGGRGGGGGRGRGGGGRGRGNDNGEVNPDRPPPGLRGKEIGKMLNHFCPESLLQSKNSKISLMTPVAIVNGSRSMLNFMLMTSYLLKPLGEGGGW